MSAQHTPGPWWVRTRAGHDGKIVDCFVAAKDVNGFAYDAEIMGDDEYRDDIERKLADANLIASAPDLVLERDAWFNQAAEALTERDALKARVTELQARNSKLVQILAGIHELLNPPPVEHEGKTYRFVNPDANDVLDELSNRIRAIPDSIDTSMAVIAASKEAP